MVSGTVRTEGVCLGDVKIRFPLGLFGKRRNLAFRGEAGKLKVALLIRGCVYVAEGPSIRPQPCLKKEAEGSATVAPAAGSDRGSLGNVVRFSAGNWCTARKAGTLPRKTLNAFEI